MLDSRSALLSRLDYTTEGSNIKATHTSDILTQISLAELSFQARTCLSICQPMLPQFQSDHFLQLLPRMNCSVPALQKTWSL